MGQLLQSYSSQGKTIRKGDVVPVTVDGEIYPYVVHSIYTLGDEVYFSVHNSKEISSQRAEDFISGNMPFLDGQLQNISASVTTTSCCSECQQAEQPA